MTASGKKHHVERAWYVDSFVKIAYLIHPLFNQKL
jgi:hypothetical protein